MTEVWIGVGLVLLAIWLVRLIYAPDGAYTGFAMILILVSMAYFSQDTKYVPQAHLLYTV
jgi:glucose dehydrogenase